MLDQTRHSLIVRLQDSSDQAAWTEFVELYQPLIENVARKLGMPDHDRQDAIQEVLLHLTKVISHWNPDAERASFRGWLYRVSRNLLIRWAQNKDLAVIGTGQTAIHALLAQHQDPAWDQQSAEFDLDFRKQVFMRAAMLIQPRFQSRTWQAFWLTVVEGHSVAETSERLGLQKGSIYVARCRIMAELKTEARRLLEQHDLPWARNNPTAEAIERGRP